MNFVVTETNLNKFKVTVLPPTVFKVTMNTGIPGVGVPPGGTARQVLEKQSDADYHTDWVTPTGGGGTGFKAGQVDHASFSGAPLTYQVTFSTPYLDTGYSISICGSDSRIFTYLSKTAAGFIISANSSTALTGEVSWTTVITGEQ